MEEKLHRRWVKIGEKKGSIFEGNFQFLLVDQKSTGNLGETHQIQTTFEKSYLRTNEEVITYEIYGISSIKTEMVSTTHFESIDPKKS